MGSRGALSHAARLLSSSHRPVTLFRSRIPPRAPCSLEKLARLADSETSASGRSTPTSIPVPLDTKTRPAAFVGGSPCTAGAGRRPPPDPPAPPPHLPTPPPPSPTSRAPPCP